MTSRSFTNAGKFHHVFIFTGKHLPSIKLRGPMISCQNVLDFPFEISVSTYPILVFVLYSGQ